MQTSLIKQTRERRSPKRAPATFFSVEVEGPRVHETPSGDIFCPWSLRGGGSPKRTLAATGDIFSVEVEGQGSPTRTPATFQGPGLDH